MQGINQAGIIVRAIVMARDSHRLGSITIKLSSYFVHCLTINCFLLIDKSTNHRVVAKYVDNPRDALGIKVNRIHGLRREDCVAVAAGDLQSLSNVGPGFFLRKRLGSAA